jgi:hypothetical protein
MADLNLGRPANDDMVEGYRDGLDLNSPEPSGNRSASYRHGFLNGRADRAGKPRASFQTLIAMADAAMAEDDLSQCHNVVWLAARKEGQGGGA